MEVVANIGGARESGSCRPSRGLVRRRRLGRRLVLGLRGSTVTPLGRCNGLTTGSEQPKNSTPPPRCEEHSTITVSCLPTENSHKYMIYIYIYIIYIYVCVIPPIDMYILPFLGRLRLGEVPTGIRPRNRPDRRIEKIKRELDFTKYLCRLAQPRGLPDDFSKKSAPEFVRRKGEKTKDAV